jgi:hypothetical protein
LVLSFLSLSLILSDSACFSLTDCFRRLSIDRTGTFGVEEQQGSILRVRHGIHLAVDVLSPLIRLLPVTPMTNRNGTAVGPLAIFYPVRTATDSKGIEKKVRDAPSVYFSSYMARTADESNHAAHCNPRGRSARRTQISQKKVPNRLHYPLVAAYNRSLVNTGTTDGTRKRRNLHPQTAASAAG